MQPTPVALHIATTLAWTSAVVSVLAADEASMLMQGSARRMHLNEAQLIGLHRGTMESRAAAAAAWGRGKVRWR